MSRLRITAAGFHFVAETNPDAPLTVAAFTKLLPYRQKVIHVRWSGEGVWVPLGDWQLGVGFENHTSHPSVGDILFYPGGYSETEIILAYGSCSFSSKMGQLAGNHFLTIVEGREQLRELGRKTLWEGAQDVAFELAGRGDEHRPPRHPRWAGPRRRRGAGQARRSPRRRWNAAGDRRAGHLCQSRRRAPAGRERSPR